MPVTTHFKRLVDLLFHDVGGQGDDGGTLPLLFPLPLPDASGGGITVHHRHLYIHHHQIIAAVLETSYRLQAVLGNVDDTAGFLDEGFEQHDVVRGVFDQKKLQPHGGLGALGGGGLFADHRHIDLRSQNIFRADRRQPGIKLKLAPLALLALHRDSAVHELDQLGADGQPKTAAAIFPGRSAVTLGEDVKNRRLLFRWNADAGVGYGKEQAIAPILEIADVNGYHPFGGEFHGVADDIHQQLPQAVGVAETDGLHIVGDYPLDPKVAGADLQAKGLYHSVHQLLEIELGQIQDDLAALHPAEIQDVVDEMQQRLTILLQYV